MPSPVRCRSRRNPETDRCVDMDGRIGRHIIGRPIRCDTIRNTKGRCVMRNSSRKRNYSKAQKISKKRKKRKTPRKSIKELTCIPRKFEGLVHNCECISRWKRLTNIGSGAYGTAYHACTIGNSKDCEYVVKVQPYNATAKRELDAYMRLKKKTDIVPKLHAAWLCGKKLYLVIDQMFECRVNKQAFARQVRDVLQRFLALGWCHVDVHSGNIMCNKNGDVCLIDLGWAVHKSDEPYKAHPAGIRTFKEAIQVQNANFRYLNS